METIEEAIRSFIAENLLYSNSGFSYPDQASFLENGIVDSMNVMEIVMFVEDRFDIKVQDSEILPDNFDSVSQLARFIRSKQVEEKNP